LEAGANAVCFGLTILNSRRQANNFRPEEMLRVVQTIHAHRARAVFALNIDLAERELEQAARILQFVRHCRVDAVLVCDPALLVLRPEFPELEFHLSAAACTTSGAGVTAAGQLGLSQVTLAPELTLAEVAAASVVPDVAIAVVVQRSPCEVIPGRCLLSSWVSGRSDRRGARADPCCGSCGVGVSLGHGNLGQTQALPGEIGQLIAVRDHLAELQRSRVATLAIEGRGKSAGWLRRAVELYRKVLDGGDWQTLSQAAAELEADTDTSSVVADDAQMSPAYDLEIHVAQQIRCRCRCGGQTAEWTMPKTVVRRKAIAIGHVFEQLGRQVLHGHRLDRATCNDPEFMLVPRAANALIDRISAVIHQARKAPEQQVQIELPPAVRALLEKGKPSAVNRLPLGAAPNRARLDAAWAASFLSEVRPQSVVVEGLTPDNLEPVISAAAGIPVVAVVPPVFFEDEIPALRNLVDACVRRNVTVEVNSWGGWQLARESGAKMESGPGLPVLNSLAASMLGSRGVQCVTLSVEADRRQMEELTSVCSVPCSIVVFGRLPLCISRTHEDGEPPDATVIEGTNVRLEPRREGGLIVVRPADPFDLRSTNHEGIRARCLVVDLIGSPDPVSEWHHVPSPKQRTFRFNYDRTLL
jgi:collagenase-like PrtC family protease